MGMLNFYVWKNLGKEVNVDEYFKNIEKHEKSLFLKAVNFMSDHAVGIRRMKALKKAQDMGNWDIHGKML